MDYYEGHGRNTRLTCRHFNISPQAFYRWLSRYRPRHLAGLKDRRRPPAPVASPVRPSQYGRCRWTAVRVPGPVRDRVPAARHPALRPTTPLPEAQRPHGAGPADAHRGVI
ncbi:MAG: helix-turn-helix domain-containing protein [Chloroflexi bacterium]|nr:helix-turn-helix domain-containing protein [Chloroflexota bacterium]